MLTILSLPRNLLLQLLPHHFAICSQISFLEPLQQTLLWLHVFAQFADAHHQTFFLFGASIKCVFFSCTLDHTTVKKCKYTFYIQ